MQEGPGQGAGLGGDLGRDVISGMTRVSRLREMGAWHSGLRGDTNIQELMAQDSLRGESMAGLAEMVGGI